MDSVVSQFLTAGSAILALSVVIVTFFVRRVVETAVPSLKKMADENDPSLTYAHLGARWWNQLVIYLLPVVTGSAITAANVPFLVMPGMTALSTRIFFGAVVGWFSSVIYKAVRMAIKTRTGVDINPTASIVPDPDKDA